MDNSQVKRLIEDEREHLAKKRKGRALQEANDSNDFSFARGTIGGLILPGVRSGSSSGRAGLIPG